MSATWGRSTVVAAVAATLCLGAPSQRALAEKAYDPGASDTEIRIGNIAPYSGPASSLSTVSKAGAAYFKMINAQGGINGRKINFISYDDGYSPPKTVEQTRKLVESDEVFAVYFVIGTASNTAIQKYLNAKKVPQIFIGGGATKWADPQHFPWSMGWAPSYQTEARIYSRYIQENYPGKTIGILYQNDDFGRDYLTGFHEVFGKDARTIVSEVPYEVSSPTVESQIVQIRAANPDIFVNIATPKFAAQAIKKIGELNWHPVQVLTNVSSSVSAVLKPAGLDYSQEIISAAFLKDPTDPRWKDDAAIKDWREFMTKWYPEGDLSDFNNVIAYGAARSLVEVLRLCSDNLTRGNLMKQLQGLDMEVGVYLPGMRIKTSQTDWAPLEQLQLMRFKGQGWELFGPLLDGGGTSK
jgi:ABC-type branched-subunit amino acid transport system substrate-binding protein